MTIERKLIRERFVEVLTTAGFCGGRVYPERSQHIEMHEMPVCIVATPQEDISEFNTVPKRYKRSIHLDVLIIGKADSNAADVLDALAQQAETILLPKVCSDGTALPKPLYGLASKMEFVGYDFFQKTEGTDVAIARLSFRVQYFTTVEYNYDDWLSFQLQMRGAPAPEKIIFSKVDEFTPGATPSSPPSAGFLEALQSPPASQTRLGIRQKFIDILVAANFCGGRVYNARSQHIELDELPACIVSTPSETIAENSSTVQRYGRKLRLECAIIARGDSDVAATLDGLADTLETLLLPLECSNGSRNLKPLYGLAMRFGFSGVEFSQETMGSDIGELKLIFDIEYHTEVSYALDDFLTLHEEWRALSIAEKPIFESTITVQTIDSSGNLLLSDGSGYIVTENGDKIRL